MNLIKHLLTRHYDPSRYTNQVLNVREGILTVYLNNLSGQLVGFQKYNPSVTTKKTNNAQDGRYFTHCQRGVTAVWGLETLDPRKRDVYIVEGIFKASALHMIGENAIAVLTSTPKPMKSWLHTLNHNLIGIGDNDKAGMGVIKIAGKGFQLEKDVDEYDLETLYHLVRSTECLAPSVIHHRNQAGKKHR